VEIGGRKPVNITGESSSKVSLGGKTAKARSSREQANREASRSSNSNLRS